MADALVLIDANNFYASCEQALDPALLGRAVVVLSNNDGCVVSRSSEARQLGIGMGRPYFQIAEQLARHGVVVRSSNYALYGDMSQRLMSSLEPWVAELEVYSIDEAFARLPRPAGGDLNAWARELRSHIRRNLGLPIAIGIAPSKVLAKVANRIAKADSRHAGLFDLGRTADPDPWLEATPVEEIWGIGRRLGRWCRLRGIANALQLRDMASSELRAKAGVVGVRLQLELRGISCLPLEELPAAKQETCVSRSFSRPITELDELRQAVATYVVRAAEKLRRQRQRAGRLSVFARTSPFAPHFHGASAGVSLPLASNDTAVLLQAALALVPAVHRPQRRFVKAGVLLQELQPEAQLQHHLLAPLPPEQQQRRDALMAVVDDLNRRHGRGTVQWAACGLQPGWAMRRGQLSRAATTRLNDLPTVWAR
ncbi:MAG: Y-family DNA polymerase [Vulcanococcus sp.]|jgi:DNA polymerase V